MQGKIAVLLSTYNGELYLKEQLDSLFRQSYSFFHLYVRDDGSSDNTLKILEEYQKLYSYKMTIINDCKKHCGAAKSFMNLLQIVDADYYMFCDQDDIWYDTKIEKSLFFIKEKELLHKNLPIVISTDLRVIDCSLNVLNNSFNKNLKVDVFKKHPEMLFVRHIVTGCTMMFNKYAKDISLPFSSYATMHDEWIALCTEFRGGKIYVLEENTIDYRQHSSNAVGAKMSTWNFWNRIFKSRGYIQFVNALKLAHNEFHVSYVRFLWYKLVYSWL